MEEEWQEGDDISLATDPSVSCKTLNEVNRGGQKYLLPKKEVETVLSPAVLTDAFLCEHLRADKGKAHLPAPLVGAETFCLAVVFKIKGSVLFQ